MARVRQRKGEIMSNRKKKIEAKESLRDRETDRK